MLDGRVSPGPQGGSIVTFVRRIDRHVEKVWAALTLPERLADWIGEAEIELKVGGAYRLTFREGLDGKGGPPTVLGKITRIEPGRLLEHTWREGQGPESLVCWILEPDGTGCRLVLTHAFPTDEPDVIGYASGWHDFLDALPRSSEGAFVPYDQARWKELDRRYRAFLTAHVPTETDRFGVFLEGGRTLRFERLLPGPIERVWDWLIDPELVAKWFTEQHVEPWVGGKMWGRLGKGDGWTATVTAWSPPHRLAWQGKDGGGITWVLESVGDMVRMVFTQTGVRPHAGIGVGWHAFFDVLEARAAGREPPAPGVVEQAVIAEYRSRLAASV